MYAAEQTRSAQHQGSAGRAQQRQHLASAQDTPYLAVVSIHDSVPISRVSQKLTNADWKNLGAAK